MKKTYWLTSALALALTLGACSSSGDEPSADQPIDIALFGQFAAQGFAYPEVPVVIQAAVENLNSAGGINGRKVDLSVCNDQGTQAGATKCARDAVTSDAVATIVLQTRYSEAVLPLFDQANMAMVGNVASTSADYTNSASFSTGSPQIGVAGLTQQFISRGCDVITFIHWDTPTSALALPLVQKVVADGGKKLLDKNMGASGASDYGPVAASISDAGSTCALSFLPATDAVKWIRAQKQRDPNFIVGTTTAAAPVAVLTQLGQDGDNLLLASGTPDVSDSDNADIVKFLADMKAANVDPKNFTAIGVQAWGNFQLVAGAIKSVPGTPDRAAVTNAMNNITTPATGLFGDFNTTKPNSQADYARIFATDVYFYTTKDQKLSSQGPAVSQREIFN